MRPIFRCTTSAVLPEFYKTLEREDALSRYSVLLLDYRLPQENALELLKRTKLSSNAEIPMIFITGKGDEEIAVKALKLGAFDYVTKNEGYLFKLPSVIEKRPLQHVSETGA